MQLKGNTYEILGMHEVLIGPTIVCTLDIGFELTKVCRLKLARIDVDIKDKPFDYVDKIADANEELQNLFMSLEDREVHARISDVNMNGTLSAEIFYIEKDHSMVSVNDLYISWLANE